VRAPDDDDTTAMTLVLAIGGMSCASCVSHVERALRSVPGVRSAEVNLVTERATIRADATVSPSVLESAVVDEGYTASRVDDAPTTASLGDASDGAAPSGAERRPLLVSAALSLPLLALGMAHGLVPEPLERASRALQLVLATAVLFGPGRRFLAALGSLARRRAADMNTLIALGAGSAWAYSTVATLAPQLFAHADHGRRPHVYFEAVGAIVSFVLLGKALEGRAKRRLQDAVRGLLALVPATACRLADDAGGSDDEVALDALRIGDRVLVRPGARIPSDGVVLEGTSALDESMLTGESVPVDKQPGARVYGGTENQSGALVVRVTRLGAETAVARIARAVEEAQGSKAPIARLGDRVAAVFVPCVACVALTTLAFWLARDSSAPGVADALERFVAVLVIACPCAVGLATPAAVAVGTGRGAELGVLFRGGEALEAASRVDAVVLDKTGTLTEGRLEVVEVVPCGSRTARAVLALAAAAEYASEHPVGRALVAGARREGEALSSVHDFSSRSGAGVSAMLEGHEVRVGTPSFVSELGAEPSRLAVRADKLALQGRTVVFVAHGRDLAGLVALADRARTGARAVVEELRSAGLRVSMLSGDRAATARALAEELGIDDVTAEVRPEEKAARVRALQEAGHHVAMVGDGVNDAPALAAADLGVAVGGGADVALAAADVALLGEGLAGLPVALGLARATMRTIRGNLVWAFAYNVVGIPIAAGALYGALGWQLSPVLASAAMSLSSVSVLVNSLRLRGFGRA